MQTIKMWDKVPLMREYEPVLEFYPAEEKKTDATVVVLPGGGYWGRAEHEGDGYAKLLNTFGMNAFVCEYRTNEDPLFPSPLLDARRAVRYVRAHAAEFGIDPNKVALMGSSAGGHLAALTSTYFKKVDGEGYDAMDEVSGVPNATILCYPVIHCPDESNIAHWGSFAMLYGENGNFAEVSPDLLVSDETPPAFIWHTSEDPGVNVINSYRYAEALRVHNIPHEVHVFPHGGHGLGVAAGMPHVAQWTGLLKNWFCDLGWFN